MNEFCVIIFVFEKKIVRQSFSTYHLIIVFHHKNIIVVVFKIIIISNLRNFLLLFKYSYKI
jgi:hypothetical protein